MAEDRDTRDVTRRSALGWIAAAAPAIVAVSGAPRAAEDAPAAAPPPPELSDEARALAKREPGLSRDERKRLMKQLPAFEAALVKLRDFELPDDVEPAFRFRAIRSDRRSR
ncbi:MAG: hypothetical protein HY049_00740 [Acidobacteria bacterium]|nr:hypothetical protein [Acidobacteriota bacterium]